MIILIDNLVISKWQGTSYHFDDNDNGCNNNNDNNDNYDCNNDNDQFVFSGMCLRLALGSAAWKTSRVSLVGMSSGEKNRKEANAEEGILIQKFQCQQNGC